MITIPQLDFMARLKEQLQNDTQFQGLVQKIQQDPLTYPDYKLLDGLIYFKGKLFLTTNSPMKQLLLEEFHATPIGGHGGIHRTYGRIKENVYWHGMQKDVTEFVKAYVICQQVKPLHTSPFGLLHPLPIPERVWEDISLDFIIGLPSFQNQTVILVVVDRLSKAAHFGTLPSNLTRLK
jgi:hypothetical protein